MPRPGRTCPGCGQRHTSERRLCYRCRYEVSQGLYGGDWVVRKGVRIWVKGGAA